MNVKRGSEICSEKRKVASGLGCERIAGKNIRKKEASLVRIRCKPQNSEIIRATVETGGTGSCWLKISQD